MDDWATIRHLSKQGLSGRAISETLGVSRKTVKKALESASPPKYSRTCPPDSAWARAEPHVRRLLSEYPQLPTTVLAQRVGWTGGNSWFSENVARIRPEFAPKDPCDRLEHLPGEQVQCDLWFPGKVIPDANGELRSWPVLVMVAAFSRFIAAQILPTRTTGDLLAGMWTCLDSQIGTVPRTLLWDNEAGIGRRGCLADGVAGFCGTLGTRLIQARPYDPETKGIVERANGYLRSSFLPGRVFTGPDDFADQLAQWLTVANQRIHRRTKAVPAVQLATDRTAMLPLPPIAPGIGTTSSVRLGRDYYLSAAGSDYSVHPSVIGRLIELRTSLHTVTVTCGNQVVATHDRAWTPGSQVTDPVHRHAAARMRREFQQSAHDRAHDGASAPVEVADLAVYDAAFGIGAA